MRSAGFAHLNFPCKAEHTGKLAQASWPAVLWDISISTASCSAFGKKVTSVAHTAGEVQPPTAPPLKPHSLKYEVRSKQEVFSLTLFPLYFTKILTDLLFS